MNPVKGKMRLDQRVAALEPHLSRSRIQAEIMAGRVLVDGRICDKPGTNVSPEAIVALTAPLNPYVSRGGLKLEGALKDLALDVSGLVALDVGASTGGFTDCLLQKGARRVYALDVGYGQLDYRLREDPRVVVMERFNVRLLESVALDPLPALAVVDVSFISLKKVLPVLAAAGIYAVLTLVKPQFEAGRVDAAKGRGVIRDAAVQRQALVDVATFACKTGYCFRAATFSRWRGPKGNIEFFTYFTAPADGSCVCLSEFDKRFAALVEEARLFMDAG